ncbi:MAG: hypothetical protein ACKOSS_04255 [Planctomycetia bacterium]
MSGALQKPWRMRVRSIEGTRIELEGLGYRGPIVDSAVPLEHLASVLRPGDEVEALVRRSLSTSAAEFTTRGFDGRFQPPAVAPAASPQPADAPPPEADPQAAVPRPAASREAAHPAQAAHPAEAVHPADAAHPAEAAPAETRPPGMGATGQPTRRAPLLHATVQQVLGPHDILVLAGGTEGRLVGPALVLEGYARNLKPGQPLPGRVRRIAAGPDGVAQFEAVAKPPARRVVAAMSMRQAWRKVVDRWQC